MANRNQSWTERKRNRIQSAKLIERMIAHVLGEIEMTASQITAAKFLINKVLPDLSTQVVQIEDRRGEPREMSLGDLMVEWEQMTAGRSLN